MVVMYRQTQYVDLLEEKSTHAAGLTSDARLSDSGGVPDGSPMTVGQPQLPEPVALLPPNSIANRDWQRRCREKERKGHDSI